jgi:hypothetical protein
MDAVPVGRGDDIMHVETQFSIKRLCLSDADELEQERSGT